jgi:class 3 adenylate cyclase
MAHESGTSMPRDRLLINALYAKLQGVLTLADILEVPAANLSISSLWKVFQGLIKEYGGIIHQQLGDSFLVVWGLPSALEDDAERGVAAALALLRALQEFREAASHPAEKSLKLQLGFHTGLALAGDLGPEDSYALMGEAINTARQLQGIAEPDSLIVGEATYQAIRGAFQVKRLTPTQLEGTQQLVNIYQILEELPQPTKLRYRSKGGLETVLVGREEEMARLESLFQAVLDEGQPRLALVTGDVGVGKSRLLFEFVGKLETHNPLLTVMSSRALDQTSRVPYYLWKELWSNRFELSEDDPPETGCKKTIDGVLTLWGRSLGEVTAVEAAHFLGSLIGVRWEKSRYLDPYQNHPGERMRKAFELMEELLFRASQRGPVVLILDDLHWADQGSLDLIHYLWQSAEKNIPLLILTCARSSFLAKGLELFPNAEFIRLEPLPVAAEMVRKAYPAVREAPDELLATVAERAAGNPYFMEELVKNVLASQGENLPQAGPIKNLPNSLETLLKSRLDSLSLEGRATAYFAAVAGRVFWKGSVLAAFRKSPGVTKALSVSSHNLVGKVQSALDELMEKELAFLRVGSSFAGEREYIFKHSLLREVAYKRLPEEYREECHLAVADWLVSRTGPERSICVAYHYEKARAYDIAQEYYTRAADYAESIGQQEEADEIRYQARTLPAETEQRIDE